MPRTSEDLIGTRVGMTTVIVTVAATTFAILVSTADWSMWGYWSDFFANFNRWPWIRMSLLLTMVTFLSAAANGRQQSKDDQWLIYGMIQVPFTIALIWPRELGTSGDENGGLLFVLVILIHEIAHNVLRSEARRAMIARIEEDRNDPYGLG